MSDFLIVHANSTVLNIVGFEYEGLTHYDKTRVTENPQDWVLPDFLMSTYDGDVVSWRLMIPHTYVSGPDSAIAGGDTWYVYQTMLRLPIQWNMTYDSSSGNIDVFVYGSSGVCGPSFDNATEEVTGIVFEDPNGGGSSGGDPGINRLRR